MRLALAQINTVVGDLDGNRALILSRLEEAREAGADLVLFPELAVTGYPPEDLLLRPAFVRAARRSLDEIAAATRGIVGARRRSRHFDGDLYNACAVCADGEVRRGLPQAVPAELRRLRRGAVLRLGRDLVLLRLGECARRRDDLRGHVAAGPAGDRPRARGRAAARQRLRLAVPRRQGARARGDVPAARARHVRFVAFVNAVGGQDELIFDGHSRRPRRRGRGARAGARVRGGAARRRRRPDRGDGAAAERDAAAGAGAGAGASRRRSRPSSSPLDRARPCEVCPCRSGRAARRRARADAARARARAARLRREERLLATSSSGCPAGSTRR